MTTIVGLDTVQVLGIVDDLDHKGVGAWVCARPLEWRLGVQVVAIGPSAAFRKALRMWLPRTAASVDAFHLVKLGNDMLTEVRQRLTGATTAKVEANNIAIKQIKEPAGDSTTPATTDAYSDAPCRQNSCMSIHHCRTFTTNREEPCWLVRGG